MQPARGGGKSTNDSEEEMTDPAEVGSSKFGEYTECAADLASTEIEVNLLREENEGMTESKILQFKNMTNYRHGSIEICVWFSIAMEL